MTLAIEPSALTALRTMIQNQYPQLGKKSTLFGKRFLKKINCRLFQKNPLFWP